MSVYASSLPRSSEREGVVGLVPGIGEIADGINGAISLARGDYIGAALSFTSMIPLVGDAIGKGGKATRFMAGKADDLLAAENALEDF